MSDLGPTDGAIEDTVDRAVENAVEETDVRREELLKRVIVSLAEAEDIDVPDAEEVAAIQSRLDELDAELDEKVEDLRDRFVDLYKDLERKAPADHAHEETADRLESIATDLVALSDRLDEVEADVDAWSTVDGAVEDRIDGIDERLARVESNVESLDEFDDKLSRIASAVVRIRRRLEAAERDRADREQLDALAAAANRHGVRKADCTDCGNTVRLGLLTSPECPHCGRQFAELEPNPGFLGTSKLVVGDQPALDGNVDGTRDGAGRVGDDAQADNPGGSRGVSARDDTDERGGS